MRLIHCRTLELREFFSQEVPPYAILSHTWGDDEVSFTDFVENQAYARHKAGYRKAVFGADKALEDGFEYCWFDTCCIDKRSSSELSEAVISMYRWYHNASKCYVLLPDVRQALHSSRDLWINQFKKSRWHTRGWTLQELLAPKVVEFYDRDDQYLGDKNSLEQELYEITGIPLKALQGGSLTQYSIKERLSWAAHRQTTRAEDTVYSLMGLLNVSMPLLYGEGYEKAFYRLRREIDELGKFEPPPAYSVPSPETSVQFDLIEGIKRHRLVQSEQVIRKKTSIKTTFEEFTYAGSLVNNEIRIFTLEPGVMGRDPIVGHLQSYSLDNIPGYNALSYVWGQEPEIHQITIDSKTTSVRPNLFQALQRMRLRAGPMKIWVDSICMNQNDLDERNAQVRLMSTIYAKAESVLIWLGESDSSSNLAMEFVPQIIHKDFNWEGPWWEQFGFKGLAQLLERVWFRRGWVLQEVAFSKNATIHCGDRQIYLDHFAMAVELVRAQLQNLRLSKDSREGRAAEILASFVESPAVRLLDTIERAFRKSAGGDLTRRRLTLETLVEIGSFNETTDYRDAIYALLNLANDVANTEDASASDTIIPDYTKGVLDVFVDFVLHCARTGSIDIICRPIFPTVARQPMGQPSGLGMATAPAPYPTWMMGRDRLPHGDPAFNYKHRLHADSLVAGSRKTQYTAHNGTAPQVSAGRKDAGRGPYDGSLHVKGIRLGQISRRSTRMANAVITKDCLQLLGQITRKARTNLIDIPETLWRTLCADRDDNGEPARYKTALLHLFELISETGHTDTTSELFEDMVSIDVEELLDSELPGHVRRFLEVVQRVVWNRRTFQATAEVGACPLVGLAPQHARIGDFVCILFGCSVPVILRRHTETKGDEWWSLIGDAYVDGMMDGEALEDVSAQSLQAMEVEFDIR